MSSSRIWQGVSIGARLFSIVISGVLWHEAYKHLYSHFVRDSEHEFSSNEDYSDCYKVIRMKIPTYAKGGIIGKNGSTIRRIQEKTKTTIKFLSKNKPTTENNEEKQLDWNFDDTNEENQDSFDMILIRGLTLRVMEAEKEIKNVIASIPVYNEENMIVDNRFIGKIIGKKGENIKRLKECYKVQIDIDRSEAPQRTVCIRGTKENITECKRDIVKTIDVMIKEGKTHPLPIDHQSRFKAPVPIPQLCQNNEKHSEELFKSQYVKYPGEVNENINIYVCSVVDCCRFYAHIVGDDLKSLVILIDEMTEFFSNEKDSDVDQTFNVGDVLAGYYEASYTWQRVKVIEIKDNLFEVIFLDYGDSALLKATELRSFKNCKKFLDLPFQALRLVTFGIKPIHDAWSDNDINQFEKLTKVGDCFPLTAILKNKSNMNLEVQLLDENNVDIAQKLIAHGIALHNE